MLAAPDNDHEGMTDREQKKWIQPMPKREERVFSLLTKKPEDGLLPGQVKKRIRTIIWENLNYVKSEASMQKTLEELDRLREN